MTEPALRLEGLTRRFGGVTAVGDASLQAPTARITGLIGPNGAGKTTLFECLTGVERPDAGRVQLDGRDVTELPADARARLGMRVALGLGDDLLAGEGDGQQRLGAERLDE